jgi:hypothetical protein
MGALLFSFCVFPYTHCQSISEVSPNSPNSPAILHIDVHYCPVDDAPSVCNRMMRLSLRAIWGGVDLNWV